MLVEVIQGWIGDAIQGIAQVQVLEEGEHAM